MDTLTSRKPVEAVIAAMGSTTARRPDLIKRGLTDWDLQRAVAEGRVRRLARSVYALPDATAFDVLLATNQAQLGCFSRAEKMGLWVLNTPPIPHVAVIHGRPVPGCKVHRFKGRLTLWDVLRHCVQCGTELEALCAVESALVKKKCTMSQLRRVFDKRKDAAMRRILDKVDPQSQSIAETCGRYFLRDAGFNVQGQASVRGMGHLDLLVEGILGVETDGEKYHNSASAWAEDLRRLNVLTIRDVPTLHVKASDAMYHPDVTVELVRNALRTLENRRR